MNNKYALCLAGGGSKGAYQIGAWKAMKELGIEFEAVAGVSIGSVNGALVTMGDFDNAKKFWDSIAVDRGVHINEELPDPDNLFSRKNWPALFREVMKNGGFDASPCRDFFNEYVDENKIRESDINFGLVTVNMSRGATPVRIFKDEIPQGQLVEYLLASADIPLAINVGPDGEKYLDGGAFDNTPIQFLRSNGYNRLIVVDIASIRGLAHTDSYENSEIVYIRPRNLDDLGASFDFSAEMNEKRMLAGYLDTKKAFSVLLGNIYYFEPDTFRSLLKKFGADALLQLEELAYKLKMEQLKIYSEDEFIEELKRLYKEDKLLKEEQKRQKEEQKKQKEENDRKKAKLLEVLSKFAGDEAEEGEPADEKQGRISAALEKLAATISDEIKTVKEAEEAKENEPTEEKQGRISTALEKLATSISEEIKAAKEAEEAKESDTTEEKQGRISAVLEKLANTISDEIKAVKETEEAKEEEPAEGEKEKKGGTISSIMEILKARYKGESNMNLAEEILENLIQTD